MRIHESYQNISHSFICIFVCEELLHRPLMRYRWSPLPSIFTQNPNYNYVGLEGRDDWPGGGGVPQESLVPYPSVPPTSSPASLAHHYYSQVGHWSDQSPMNRGQSSCSVTTLHHVALQRRSFWRNHCQDWVFNVSDVNEERERESVCVSISQWSNGTKVPKSVPNRGTQKYYGRTSGPEMYKNVLLVFSSGRIAYQKKKSSWAFLPL